MIINGSILACTLAAVAAAIVIAEGFRGPIMTLLILSSSSSQAVTDVDVARRGASRSSLNNRWRRCEGDPMNIDATKR